MTQRYNQPSEYGGYDGPSYRKPDRTPRSLSAGERARLLRSEGMQPGSPYDPSRPQYNPATRPDPGSEQLAPGFRQN